MDIDNLHLFSYKKYQQVVIFHVTICNWLPLQERSLELSHLGSMGIRCPFGRGCLNAFRLSHAVRRQVGLDPDGHQLNKWNSYRSKSQEIKIITKLILKSHKQTATPTSCALKKEYLSCPQQSFDFLAHRGFRDGLLEFFHVKTLPTGRLGGTGIMSGFVVCFCYLFLSILL